MASTSAFPVRWPGTQGRGCCAFASTMHAQVAAHMCRRAGCPTRPGRTGNRRSRGRCRARGRERGLAPKLRPAPRTVVRTPARNGAAAIRFRYARWCESPSPGCAGAPTRPRQLWTDRYLHHLQQSSRSGGSSSSTGSRQAFPSVPDRRTNAANHASDRAGPDAWTAEPPGPHALRACQSHDCM
jgi:hypothetical protein